MSTMNAKAIAIILALFAVLLVCEMASAQYGGGRYGGRGYDGYGGGWGNGGGYGGRGRGYGYGGRGGYGYGGRGYGGGRGGYGYGGRGYGGYGRGSRTTSYGSSYGSSLHDQTYPSESFTNHNDLSQSDTDLDSYNDGYSTSYGTDVYTASSSSASPSTATVIAVQPASQADRQADWQLEQESSQELPRMLWNAGGRGQQPAVNVFEGPFDMVTGDRLPEAQLDNRQPMLERNRNHGTRQSSEQAAGANSKQGSLIATLNAIPMVPSSTTTAAPEYVMINPTRNSSRNNNAETLN